MIEDVQIGAAHDLAVINISLHESGDIERAVECAHAALDPAGSSSSVFLFPEHEEDCRTVPGRLRCGVRFYEAHIGCQLLPTARFVDLAQRWGSVRRSD